MGIPHALSMSVMGLQAQPFAPRAIAGNIANSQTTAYKESDTRGSGLPGSAVRSQYDDAWRYRFESPKAVR
jgi:flagellar hook protein FlgE